MFDDEEATDEEDATMMAVDDVDVDVVPYADELGFLTVDYLSKFIIRQQEDSKVLLDLTSEVELFRGYIQNVDYEDSLSSAFNERMVACILMHPLAMPLFSIRFYRRTAPAARSREKFLRA